VANYSQLYGSVGAVIAFLVWMYLLALVAMGGCEFNAALDRSGRK
jgi:membrane protein